MPTYTYRCEKCDETFDEINTISERHRARCRACGHWADKVFPPPRPPSVHGFKLGYFEHISHEGEYVKSKKHLKELCDRHGVYAPGVLD